MQEGFSCVLTLSVLCLYVKWKVEQRNLSFTPLAQFCLITHYVVSCVPASLSKSIIYHPLLKSSTCVIATNGHITLTKPHVVLCYIHCFVGYFWNY